MNGYPNTPTLHVIREDEEEEEEDVGHVQGHEEPSPTTPGEDTTGSAIGQDATPRVEVRVVEELDSDSNYEDEDDESTGSDYGSGESEVYYTNGGTGPSPTQHGSFLSTHNSQGLAPRLSSTAPPMTARGSGGVRQSEHPTTAVSSVINGPVAAQPDAEPDTSEGDSTVIINSNQFTVTVVDENQLGGGTKGVVKRPEVVPRRGSLSSKAVARRRSSTLNARPSAPPTLQTKPGSAAQHHISANAPVTRHSIGSSVPYNHSPLSANAAGKKKGGHLDPLKSRKTEGKKRTNVQDPVAIMEGTDITGTNAQQGGVNDTSVTRSSDSVSPVDGSGGKAEKKTKASTFLWPDMSSQPVDADEAKALDETRRRAARRAKQEKFRSRFDPQDWSTYILTMHATVIQTVYLRVLGLFTVALIITIWNHYSQFPDLSSTPHLVSGGALSLLIVFRTNSSYGRFWEGRDVFGRLFAQAIDTVRQAQLWIQAPYQPDGTIRMEDLQGAEELRTRFARFLTVFPFAVKQEIRGEDLQELETLWDDPDFLSLIELGNIPNSIIMAAAQSLRMAVAKGYVSHAYSVRMDSGLTKLLEARAAAEKISSTPVPYVFAVEGSRFLSVFLVTLPIVIVRSYGWGTPIVVAMMSYFFLAVEAVGSEVEDPFGQDFNDIPLDNMCDVHREDVFEMMAFGKQAVSLTQAYVPAPGRQSVAESIASNHSTMRGRAESGASSVGGSVPAPQPARLSAVKRLRGLRRHSFINVDQRDEDGGLVVTGRTTGSVDHLSVTASQPARRRSSLQPPQGA